LFIRLYFASQLVREFSSPTRLRDTALRLVTLWHFALVAFSWQQFLSLTSLQILNRFFTS